MQPIDLWIIVAMTPGGVIGNKGKLPWHLPSDLARFKEITKKAGTVIMGRATYESILAQNGKPLPERRHIVLTKKPFTDEHESVCFVGSTKEACIKAASYGTPACIIGGKEIYKIFLSDPSVTKMYITLVHASITGDTHFPVQIIDLGKDWKRVSTTDSEYRGNDEHKTIFLEYTRS